MIMALDFVTTVTDPFVKFIPKFGAAVAVLIVGLIVIRFVIKALKRVLEAAGIDKLGERLGAGEALGKIGMGGSLSTLIATLVRLVLTVVVVVIAVGLLGVDSFQQTLNDTLNFIPKLLIAIVVLMVAVLLGGKARERVDAMATQMDLRGPLGLLVEVFIIVALGLVAMAQIGMPTELLIVLIAVIVAGVALTGALSFGLGSTDVVRQISAGRYLGELYHPGQHISIDDIAGEVVAMDSTACVIRTEHGHTVRVPNHRLLTSVVTVHDDPQLP